MLMLPRKMVFQNERERIANHSDFTYQKVQDHSPEFFDDQKTGTMRDTNNHLRFIFSHFLVLLVTSFFWGVQLYTRPCSNSSRLFSKYQIHNSTIVPGANFYYCGNNVETAKARGCVYDILNNHWVPSNCIDQAAIEEYQSDDTWRGYRDANHTELLSLDEMGEIPMYYTNERDHIVHCAMLWRKQYRAFSEGRTVFDSIIVDEEHTMHCSQYLIDMTTWGPDFRTMPIKVFVGFAGCHVKE